MKWIVCVCVAVWVGVYSHLVDCLTLFFSSSKYNIVMVKDENYIKKWRADFLFITNIML